MPEKISFKTLDEVTIVGDWVAAPTTTGAVILLHMMPANRKSWAEFQIILAKRGLASLAIDLRGHGESIAGPKGSTLDFNKFTNLEHQSSLYDVDGAYEWVLRRGFEKPKVGICGASFGANLALQFLSHQARLPCVALLSPGRDYHGTNAVWEAGAVLPHQGIWVTASEGDDNPSFEASKEIMGEAESKNKVFNPLKNAGHGTAILASQPQLAEQLADWFKQIIVGV